LLFVGDLCAGRGGSLSALAHSLSTQQNFNFERNACRQNRRLGYTILISVSAVLCTAPRWTVDRPLGVVGSTAIGSLLGSFLPAGPPPDFNYPRPSRSAGTPGLDVQFSRLRRPRENKNSILKTANSDSVVSEPLSQGASRSSQNRRRLKKP